MKKWKNIICFLLAIAIVISLLNSNVMTESIKGSNEKVEYEKSGNGGTNVNWYYDSDSQILTVSGKGKIYKRITDRVVKKNVKKLVIEEGITAIGESVFDGLTFSEIQLPDSLKIIGDYAFYSCPNLKKITIPKNVTRIGSGAFMESFKLKEITILGNIKSSNSFIGEGYNITLNLAGFCKPMGVMAVYNNLKINILKTNKSYIKKKGFIMSPNERHVYLYVGKAKEIKIPDSVKLIEAGAFSWKDNIVMGKNIEKIKKWGFYYCTFDVLALPKNLKRIEAGAFSRAIIGEIIINDKLKYIGEGAFNDTSIDTVTINHKITIKEDNFPGSKLKYIKSTKQKTIIQDTYYWDRKNKKDKVGIHFLQVKEADGYEIKISQPGNNIKKMFDTNSKKVKYSTDGSVSGATAIVKQNFKVKTKNNLYGDKTYKKGNAIYVNVRPYRYKKGKKVYGSWSSRTKTIIDDEGFFIGYY